jgi:sulfite exporter TauE/SafE
MTCDLDLLLPAGVAALAAGLTGSLHCLLMCGPLACAAATGTSGKQLRPVVAWHGGRLIAYALVGMLLGGLGSGLARTLSVSLQPVLPWMLALSLVATAFEVGKRFPAIPGVAKLSSAIVRASARWTPTKRAFAMGAATPFLPCGLLYGVFLSAAALGSGPGGGLVLAMFAFGGIPALLSAQVGSKLLARFHTNAFLLRRGVPLVAAAILVWRALATKASGGTASCH